MGTAGTRFYGTILLWGVLIWLPACNDVEVAVVPPIQQLQSRTLDISSDENLYKPTIKVALMVDNSNSMQDEQSLLADGIARMMDSLRGMKEVNVDFFVYTTTSLDKDLALPHAAATSSLRYIVPSRPELALTAAPPLSTAADYLKESVWNLAAPVNGMSLQLRVGMSPEDFLAVKSSLSETIASIGIDGATDEAGLCTIGRIIAEDGPGRIFKAGDKVALIVISDMNDSSGAGSCLRKVSQLFRYDASDPGAATAVPAAEGTAEWYRYEMNLPRPGGTSTYSFSYDYADSETWTMRVRYTSANPADWLAQFSVIYRDSYRFAYSASFSHANTFSAQYTYTYTGSCLVDGQSRPCQKTSGTTSVGFSPSAIGMPVPAALPAATGNSCPAALLTHLQNSVLPALSPPGLALKSCSYSVHGTTGTPSNVAIDNATAEGPLGLPQAPPATPPTSPGTTSATAACPQSVKDHIIGSRGLAADTIFFSCSYTYSETTLRSANQDIIPKPATVPANSSSNANCQSDVSTLSRNWAAANLPGKAWRNCRYSYSNPVMIFVAPSGFDPASYRLAPPAASSLSRQSDGSYLASGIGCPSSISGLVPPSKMIDDARALVPAGGSYYSCSYDYRASGYVPVASRALTAAEAGAAGLTLPTSCTSSSSPCRCSATAGVLDWLAGATGVARAPRTCNFHYTAGAAASNVRCSLSDDAANVALNLCSPAQGFSRSGATYADLGAYFRASCAGAAGLAPDWASCVRTGWKNTHPNPAPKFLGEPPQSVSIKDALASDAATLPDAIVRRARSLFGNNGFFMAGILHLRPENHPGLVFPDACAPEMAEGEGSSYLELMRQLGDSGFVQSVCSPDYSAALNRLRDFIIRNSVNTYRLPAEPVEFLLEISILHQGSPAPVKLDPATDYLDHGYSTSEGGLLVEFTPGLIEKGDLLKFTVGRKVRIRAPVANP